MTEKNKSVHRPGVQDGYDMWAPHYDKTPNPLVTLDRRYTLDCLAARTGERILDAGCGTGTHLRALRYVGACPIGVDLSLGMLRVARNRLPGIPLAQADLNQRLPVERKKFDATLSCLVSEHLTNLRTFFSEALAVLRDGGRFIFSAFHPEMAAAGIEANFEQNGSEYRLGAERHTVNDYLGHISDAGFDDISYREYAVDDRVVAKVPAAVKYLGHPLLLIIQAKRPVFS